MFHYGNKYIGTWLNDDMHGHGQLFFKNNSVYSGEFFQGAKHGPGTLEDIATGTIEKQFWENGWQTPLPTDSKEPVKVFPGSNESEKKSAL